MKKWKSLEFFEFWLLGPVSSPCCPKMRFGDHWEPCEKWCTLFWHFGHTLVIFHEYFDRISWIFEDFSIFFQLWTARSPWLLNRFRKVWAFLICTPSELSIAPCFVVVRKKLIFHFSRWKIGILRFWLCHPHNSVNQKVLLPRWYLRNRASRIVVTE